MTRRFKIPLLFGLFLLITSLTIVSQTDPAKASRMKMQGMYLYQFAKNVYWPSEYNTGDFLIGIYGSKDLFNVLNNTFKDKVTGSQKIVFDFYDRLKSVSRGYASFDYSPVGHKKSDLIKLDILLNSEQVDALSALVHRSNAFTLGKRICLKLKELIPRQQFEIPIQAAIGGKIVARESIKGFSKDVLTKIHGGGAGDRKKKLLKKQKRGKAKSKQFGKVEIPQEAFIGVLKINKEKWLQYLKKIIILN